MRSMRLAGVLFLSLAFTGLAGCGGDDGDDGGGQVDAPETDAPSVDAAIDAAPLMGLGQLCQPSMQGADCPQNAPGCLTFAAGATMGICTNICVQSATFMTNAQSQPGPLTPDPSTQNAVCTGIYTGSVGTAACSVPVNQQPAGALQPNTNYTVAVVCGIQCGAGNACPTGLTCNTQLNTCAP